MAGGWRRRLSGCARAGAAAIFAPILAAACLGLAPASARAAAPSGCKLGVIAGGEFHVGFDRNRPVMTGEIDGRPVRVLIDTGADSSLLLRDTARRLGLSLETVRGARVYGAGGGSDLRLARVDLKLAGVEVRAMPLNVAGEVGADVDMLLGQDFLSLYDVEFDLAHKVVRLIASSGCADGDMAYWAGAYDEAPIVTAPDVRGVVVPVRINGREVRATLDSGSPVSVAPLAVAASTRTSLDAAGPRSATFGGLGGSRAPARIGRPATVQIGAEVVRNPALLFGDLFAAATYEETGSILQHHVFAAPTMLLGADFLRAHRVLISQRRREIFFTYDGGTVFAAPGAPSPTSTAPPAATPASSTGG